MGTRPITLDKVAQKLRRREKLIWRRRLLALFALVSLVLGIKYVLIDRPDETALAVAWMFVTMTLALGSSRQGKVLSLISRREPFSRYHLYIKDE